MKIVSRSGARTLALVVAVLAVLAAGLSTEAALAAGSNENARVFAPNAHPYGQSYSEWATDWWQWALNQPAATNPVTDTTGAQCANNQSGKVWFLAGAFTNTPIHRTCTVPRGKALLIPVLNLVYAAFASDSPETRTETYVRGQAHFTPAALSATVDGVSVPAVQRYLEQSQLFSLTLPAGNVFGLAGGFVLDPCADEGYYLMLKPLGPGTHTVTVKGAGTSAAGQFAVDVTYTITVPGTGEGGDED